VESLCNSLYSRLSASTGFVLAARAAGYSLDIRLIKTANAMAQRISYHGM